MSYQISKAMLWSVEVDDKPGAVAEKLQVLADSGADLQFVTGRRVPDQPGRGVLLVYPIRGKKQEDAAMAAGFTTATEFTALRVEGTNKPGIGNRLTQAIAEAGINLHELSAIVTGKKFAAFIAFDTTTEIDKGIKAIRRAS